MCSIVLRNELRKSGFRTSGPIFEAATEFLASAHHESSENSPFTALEQTRISDQLRDIKEYVKKAYSLSAKQMSRVEARLDEAEKASRRMGRKDWLPLFSGTLFTLIVTDLVPPDVTQHIFMMALHGLSHLFGADAKPIPSVK